MAVARSGDCDEWEGSFKDRLTKEIKEYAETAQKDLPGCTIFRIPPSMMDGLDRGGIMCYAPETIALGLFHESRQYSTESLRNGEEFKFQMAGAFLTSINMKNEKRQYLTLESSQSDSESKKNVEEEQRYQETKEVPGVRESVSGIAKASRIYDVAESSSPEVVVQIDVQNNGHVGDVVQSSVQLLSRNDGILTEWRMLCKLVLGWSDMDLKRTLDCYDLQRAHELQEKDSRILKSKLTLDAIVVGCLFAANFCRTSKRMFPFPLVEDCVDKQAVYGGLQVEDFLKLENQIPLFLLGNVLRLVWNDQDEVERILNGACAKVVRDFSGYLPGCDVLNNDRIDYFEDRRLFQDCDHLLDCVAKVLRRSREITDVREPSNLFPSFWERKKFDFDFLGVIKKGISKALRVYKHLKLGRGSASEKFRVLKIPSATLLRKSGISIRGHSGATTHNLLPVFKHSLSEMYGTLYIPRLPVLSNVTWTLWRNIVAFELGKNRQSTGQKRRDRELVPPESQLHAFLALMHCLIDTEEDVMLLMEGEYPILPSGSLSKPDDVVKMFSTILKGQPFVDYPEWVALANEIHYFQELRPLLINSKRRQLLYVGSFSITLLALMALLTFYVIATYYRRH